MVFIAKIKVFSLIVVFLFLSFSLLANEQEHIAISPKNTIFLFDFDDVVVTSESSRALWGSLATVVQHPWVLMLLLKPAFYRDIVRSIAKNLYAEGARSKGLYYYLDHLEKSHSYFTPDVKEAFLQALNKCRPIAATLRIVASLKAAGYRVYIFTNKDRICLMQYAKPYLQKAHACQLDLFFDGYFCADHATRKPDPAIYTWVAGALCKNGIEHLVVFDDKEGNVAAAHAAHAAFKAFHVPKPEIMKAHTIIEKALMWNKPTHDSSAEMIWP